jgi:hypothetical protein
MNCPKCGREMEKGFVNAPRFGNFWGDRPMSNIFRGEIIVGNSGLLFTNYEAFRCTNYGFILVKYAPKPKPKATPIDMVDFY